jgi:hypothetical protein
MSYAGWTAIGTALLSGVMLLGAASTGQLPLLWLLSVYLLLVVQIIVGWQLRTAGSEWNAWALMTVYALQLVISIVRDGNWSGIVVRLLIGAVYVRGYMAVVDYRELTTAINNHPDVDPEFERTLAG